MNKDILALENIQVHAENHAGSFSHHEEYLIVQEQIKQLKQVLLDKENLEKNLIIIKSRLDRFVDRNCKDKADLINGCFMVGDVYPIDTNQANSKVMDALATLPMLEGADDIVQWHDEFIPLIIQLLKKEMESKNVKK